VKFLNQYLSVVVSIITNIDSYLCVWQWFDLIGVYLYSDVSNIKMNFSKSGRKARVLHSNQIIFPLWDLWFSLLWLLIFITGNDRFQMLQYCGMGSHFNFWSWMRVEETGSDDSALRTLFDVRLCYVFRPYMAIIRYSYFMKDIEQIMYTSIKFSI
jgi:hypothetical protein